MPEFESVTLVDPSSSLTATFVPEAGMVGTSLSEDGAEFLGQRRGLDAYVSDAKTMGIPILYPWANRLSGNGYEAGGAQVTLTPGAGGVRTEENGWPMHGVLAAYPGTSGGPPRRRCPPCRSTTAAFPPGSTSRGTAAPARYRASSTTTAST